MRARPTRPLALLSLLALLAVCLLSLGLREARADGPGDPPARWTGGTPVALARPTSRCDGVRVGAWVRLHCARDAWVFGIRLLGGSATGVELKTAKPAPGAYLIFPLREGDRRLFVIETLAGSSGYSVEVAAYATVSEVWLPGEAEPTITVD